MNKSEIRKIYQKKRLDLSPTQVQSWSRQITNNFINNLLPKIPNFADKKIAFYIATNNEVETKFLIDHFKESNILALPRIISDNIKLNFKQYKIGDELEKNILYPSLSEPKLNCPDITPDIIFVPLTAFNNSCHRVGYGKGFYDLTMHYYRKNHQNATFIGLAYRVQLCDKIPVDDHDQNLDFIVSENNIFSSKHIATDSPSLNFTKKAK